MPRVYHDLVFSTDQGYLEERVPRKGTEERYGKIPSALSGNLDLARPGKASLPTFLYVVTRSEEVVPGRCRVLAEPIA